MHTQFRQSFSNTTTSRGGRSGSNSGQRSNKLSNSQLMQIYLQRENFYQEVARRTMDWYHSFAKILAPSQIGGFYTFFRGINVEFAEKFMEQLCTGAEVKS